MDLKKILLVTLSFILGLVFVFSGYTKLYPIELFEFNFVDLGVANWNTAPIISRLIIAIELAIGIMLLINFGWKKIAYKSAIGLLLFFTIYLIFAIVKDGNKGNCGCFGTVLQMTPAESIVKNVIMLILVYVLMKFHTYTPLIWIRYKNIVWTIIIVVGITTPFILNPVNGEVVSNFSDDAKNYPLDLSVLYEDPNYPGPEENLKEGRRLIAFLSLTCSHCRIAAFKLHIIKKKHPSIPINFILNGEKSLIEKFQLDTRSQNVPYMLFNNPNFLKLSGPYLPAVFLVENSIVKKKYNYLTIDEDELVKFLEK